MESIQSRAAPTISATPVRTIDMDTIGEEIDIYSRSSFQELQNQRFEENLDLYVCVVRENDRTFLFDASGFIENCVRNHGVINNPFTRRTLDDFEIYVSSKESPEFKLYINKARVLIYPNHLPISWSDPTLSKSDRLGLMFSYGKHYEPTDLPKAINAYQNAALSGSTAAKLRLVQLYSERGERDLAVKYLSECVVVEDLSTANLYACARRLGKLQAPKLAFKAYVNLANRGNQYGLGAVIMHLELGVGVQKNPEELTAWRQKLPEAWQDKAVSDFLKHLQTIKYGVGSVGYPL